MDITIQGIKRRKTFFIEDNGIINKVPVFSLEEDQRFSISKISFATNDSLKKEIENDARKTVIENVNKALTELNMIINVTSMIKEKEYLKLQSCRVPIEGINDPPVESDKISSLEIIYGSAKLSLQDGVQSCRNVLLMRRYYISCCLELRRKWRLLSLHSIEHFSYLSVPGVRELSFKDIVGVDCSYHSAGDVLTDDSIVPIVMQNDYITISPNEKQKTLHTLHYSLVTATSVANASSKLDRYFVQSLMSFDVLKALYKVADVEEVIRRAFDKPISEFSNKTKSGFEFETSSSEQETEGQRLPPSTTTTSHQILNPPSPSSRQHELHSIENTVENIHQYCILRQHDYICRRIFAMIKDECKEYTQYDDHGTFSVNDEVSNIFSALNGGFVNSIHTAVEKDTCHSMNSTSSSMIGDGSISCADSLELQPEQFLHLKYISKTKIIFSVTSDLQLELSLVPLSSISSHLDSPSTSRLTPVHPSHSLLSPDHIRELLHACILAAESNYMTRIKSLGSKSTSRKE